MTISPYLDSTLVAGLIGAAATVGVALFTLAYQVYRDRQQRIISDQEAKIARRMSIISDLVANRFILTEGRASPRGIFAFNSALGRIPIEFIDDPRVLDGYRSIGRDFTAERFHNLIVTMISATRQLPGHVDVHLLESVPSATTNTPEVVNNVYLNGIPAGRDGQPMD